MTAMCLAAAASAAAAQEGPPPVPIESGTGPSADSDESQASIGEIIVTAQKRSERVVDVPISITVANAESLARAGISDTRQLQLITPGLQIVANVLNQKPAIRGVTTPSVNAGEEANVALYVDDVYIGAQYGGLYALGDVDHVEVLKGPQGTLFGRNATGGAIRITTRDPSGPAKIEGSLAYGFNLESKKATVFASTPISDSLSGSLSLGYERDNGFIRNVDPNWDGKKLGRTNDFNARAKLLWQPSDSVKATLAADYAHLQENNALSFRALQTVYANTPGVVLPTRKFEVSYSGTPQAKLETYGISLNTSVDIGDITLKSITAYRFASPQNINNDTDRTNVVISSNASEKLSTETFSQELNLSNSPSAPLFWTAGLFYYHEDGVFGYNTYAGAAVPSALTSSYHSTVQSDSFAGYADITYRPSEHVFLTGGLRGSYERKTYIYNDLFRAGGLPNRMASAREGWSNVSYRIVGRYEFADRANVYASYSTGFKSGGFNTSVPVIQAVSPEKIDAIEVGLKATLPGSIFVSAAAFDYRYQNIQLQSVLFANGATTFVLQNAASARIRGIEGNVSAPLFGGLTANVGSSWMPKANFGRFPNATVFIPNGTGGNTQVAPYDISGTRLIIAPRLTVNAGLSFTADVSGGSLLLSGNFYHTSGYLFTSGEVSPFQRQKSYNLVTAQATYTLPGDAIKVTVFGENLGNVAYSTYRNPGPTGDALSYGRPREIGVRLGFAF